MTQSEDTYVKILFRYYSNVLEQVTVALFVSHNSMKVVLVCNLMAAIITISCQHPDVNTPSVIKNDTTEAIKFAIAQAFFQDDLPAIYKLSQKFYFQDSILFTTDSLPFSILPDKLDTLQFKKLSRKEICDLIKKDSNQGEPPNFLYVRNFSKTDSVYSININSVSCLPFGGGGGCYIEFVKRKDSFVLLHKGYTNSN